MKDLVASPASTTSGASESTGGTAPPQVEEIRAAGVTLEAVAEESTATRTPLPRWLRDLVPTRESLLATALVAVLCEVAYLAAFAVRGELELLPTDSATINGTIGWVVFIQTVTFYLRGMCHRPWRAARFEDLNRLIRAATMALLILIAWNYFLGPRVLDIPAIPRKVLVLDWVFSILAVGSMQAIARSVYEEVAPATSSGSESGVIIASAGPEACQLAHALADLSGGRFFVSGLLDDDHQLYGARVGRARVLGPIDVVVPCAQRLRVREVLVPEGTLHGSRLRRLCEDCDRAGIRVRIAKVGKTAPRPASAGAPRAVDDSGRATTTGRIGGSPAAARSDEPSRLQIRRVELPDLLSRPMARLNEHADVVGPFLRGRRVLVTGAGGSIGSEICRQLIGFGPASLVLLERSEAALFEIHRDIIGVADEGIAIVPLLVDITSASRVRAVLREHRPDIVVHAAAYKHLPLMESHPVEAIENNTLATALLADACVEAGVETFVALSTDKAVYPSSVMGASKLVAERFLQALGPASGRRFVVVRFGNVIGSSGSAVPIFTERLRTGRAVNVTHPDVRRYFMTIEEAAQLVILAAATGDSGGLFVLDMGESIRIVDLVHAIAFVMGIPRDDVRIEYSGLRPGEKLDEQLFFADEQRAPTADERVTCAMRPERTLHRVRSWVAELSAAAARGPGPARETLLRIVAEDCGSVACEDPAWTRDRSGTSAPDAPPTGADRPTAAEGNPPEILTPIGAHGTAGNEPRART